MAKQLKDILAGNRSVKTEPGNLGKDPGVDYEPKSGDGQKFAALHVHQKHDYPHDNEHLFKGTVNYALDTPQNKLMGNKQKDAESAYFQANKTSAVKEAAEPKKAEDAQCNMTKEGVECPVHGVVECWSASGKKMNENDLDEVLTKSTTAGETISDFVHSKNPKFAGKSKEKRKQMALAAYYAKQRNEETESVEEDLAVPLLGGNLPKHRTDDTGEEISMVKAELKAIANKTMHLLASLPTDAHIEAWVQAKIATAKELVNSVHDYMVYTDRKPEEDEQMDTPMTFPNMSVDVNTGQNV